MTSPQQLFKLSSAYTPRGDQPRAIAELVEGVERGDRDQVLLGVTGSGKTFTVANVIARTGRPSLVLAPNKTLAAQLYRKRRRSAAWRTTRSKLPRLRCRATIVRFCCVATMWSCAT